MNTIIDIKTRQEISAGKFNPVSDILQNVLKVKIDHPKLSYEDLDNIRLSMRYLNEIFLSDIQEKREAISRRN